MKSDVLKIALGLLCFGLFTLYYYYHLNQESKNSTIESPLPEFLTKVFPNVLGSADPWRPRLDIIEQPSILKPEIMAQGALSYDLTGDKLLYKKNIEVRFPMASLTKIMTAIVALENLDLDQEVRIGREEADIGENTMGLSVGENVKVHDLVYGLMLHSGNDAAEAIARSSKFGRENFVYLMNKKAEELGLSDTHFTNPTGLEGDGKQYSTVYDLLVITRYALQNPEFTKIASTVRYEIPASSKHKAFYLFNETNLLTSYPGVKGVKTGYTFEAGLCLVTYLDYEGHRIIAVLLNAQNRREEMKGLLDYSLKILGVKPPPHN